MPLFRPGHFSFLEDIFKNINKSLVVTEEELEETEKEFEVEVASDKIGRLRKKDRQKSEVVAGSIYDDKISEEERNKIFGKKLGQEKQFSNLAKFVVEDIQRENPELRAEARRPKNLFTKGLDLISRPLFGAAKATDVLVNEEGNVLSKAWRAVKGLGKETFASEERLTFRDVIRNTSPEFAAFNPNTVDELGFIGDLVLDPLNLITFGTGSVLKTGRSLSLKSGKVITLTKKGEKVFQGVVDDLIIDAGKNTPAILEDAVDVFSKVVDPNIEKSRLVRGLKGIEQQERVTLARGNLQRHVREKNIQTGDAVRVLSPKQIDKLISDGNPSILTGKKVSGKTLDNLPPKRNIKVKVGGKKTEQQLRLFQIDNSNDIVPFLDETVPSKLPENRTLFAVNDKGGTRLLKGSKLNSEQAQALKEFRKKFRNTIEVSKGPKKRITATRLGDESLQIPKLTNEATLKKGGVIAVFPEELVTTSASKGRVNVKPPDSIDKVRFISPEDGKLLTLGELKSVQAQRNSIKKARKLEETRRQKLTDDLLSKEGLTKADTKKLIDQGGFKLLGKTVVSPDDFRNFLNITRIDKVVDLASKIPSIPFIRKTFKQLTREFNLDYILDEHFPEWVRFRNSLDAQKEFAIAAAEKSFLTIFGTEKAGKLKKLSKAQRTKITETIQSSKKLAKDLAAEIGLEVPTKELSAKALRSVINKGNLSTDEHAALVKLQQSFNEMLKLENEVGSLQDVVLNYIPQRYEVARDVVNTVKYRTFTSDKPVAQKFTPGEVRKFKDFESLPKEVRDKYNPVLDAGQLYLHRFFEHQKELRNVETEAFLKSAYGKNTPIEIEKDLVRLGERYMQPGFGSEPFLALSLLDKISGMFKRSATIVRPAFAGKQIVGNFTQLFAEIGIDAFKVLDPSVLGDAFSLITRGEAKFDFTDVWGIRYTADDINKLLEQFPVIKNVAIETVGAVNEPTIIKQMVSDFRSANVDTSGFSPTSKAAVGAIDLVRKGGFYLRFPAHVEDLYRTAAFLSGLKMGHSPAASMRLVDKALFNYTTGLTHVESNIRRFLIPFYSFQKFGTMLLGRTLLKKPGRIAAEIKIGQKFLESWSKISTNEELTEAERSAVPGYLLTQPSAFEGFTPDIRAKFRTFNNLTFLDVVDVLQTDQNGAFDPQETFVKGIAAQLAPYLKMPLEILVFERNLFTGKAMRDVGKIGDVDSDTLLRNLATIAGLHSGAVGGGAAFLLGEGANKLGGDEVMKKLVDWEEGFDPRTGKRTVWINPYMLHTLTNILPSMSEAFRLSRNDRSIVDKTLQTLTGVNLLEVNLKQSAEFKGNAIMKEYRDLLYRFRKLQLEGRESEAEQIRQDIEFLMDYNEAELDKLADPNIRGKRINQLDNPNANALGQ